MLEPSSGILSVAAPLSHLDLERLDVLKTQGQNTLSRGLADLGLVEINKVEGQYATRLQHGVNISKGL